MFDFLKDKLGPLFSLLLAALPFVGYFAMRKKVAALTAANDALRKDAERAAAKQAAAKAAAQRAAATKALIAEEKKAALADIEAKEVAVQKAAAKKGTAKAASAYVKAMKKGGTMLLVLAYLGYSTESARAEACPDGVSLKKGETIDCDAECLPEDELMFLLERSIKCEKDEVEHKSVLRMYQAEHTKLNDDLALCEAQNEDLAQDLAKLSVKVAEPVTPTSTYILIGIGIFVTGVALGATAVYQFER